MIGEQVTIDTPVGLQVGVVLEESKDLAQRLHMRLVKVGALDVDGHLWEQSRPELALAWTTISGWSEKAEKDMERALNAEAQYAGLELQAIQEIQAREDARLISSVSGALPVAPGQGVAKTKADLAQQRLEAALHRSDTCHDLGCAIHGAEVRARKSTEQAKEAARTFAQQFRVERPICEKVLVDLVESGATEITVNKEGFWDLRKFAAVSILDAGMGITWIRDLARAIQQLPGRVADVRQIPVIYDPRQQETIVWKTRRAEPE